MSSLDHNFDNTADEVAAIQVPQSNAARSSWLDQFSVSSKLRISIVGNAVILIAISATALIFFFGFSSTGRYLSEANTLETQALHAAFDLHRVETLLDTDTSIPNADRDARIASAFADAKEHLSSDKLWITNENLTEEMALFEGLEAEVLTVEEVILAQDGEFSPQQAREYAGQVKAIATQMGDMASALRDPIGLLTVELFEDIAFAFTVLIIMIGFGVLFSLVGAKVVSQNVVGAISDIIGAMKQADYDYLGAPVPGVERDDEIGEMARALTVFREDSLELRDLNDRRMLEAEARLAEQEEISKQMRLLRSDKSRLLEEMANGFEVSVGEVITAVSAASQQLKATSKQMVALADGSNDQAKDATEAMERATANVTAAAAATDEFALSISEISRQASSSAELARAASELVDSANTRMSQLSQAADEIGEIAGLIQTIAQRTNLLALNASIEAARGGEAGRGFAVVASEVKELAMQTSNATSSVTERIMAMQESSRSSASDLGSIVEQIGVLEKAAVMIATAVDQQSVSGDELARNIDTVATGSAQISERLSELRSASEETGTAADHVVASADALGQHAEELRDKAGRFIADVRRSARELEEGGSEAA